MNKKSISQKPEYLITLADPRQLPDLMKGPFLKGHREPRLAMIGRSNVGKSSLINALLKAQLAQMSKQPGKTRSIHFYLWNEASKIIADLPGYGYARVSQMDRNQWEKLIESYLKADLGLERALVLLDARHGPTEIDLQAIEFLSLRNIPVTFVFAKVDALKTQSEKVRRHREATQALQVLGVSAESIFWVSSHTEEGLKQLADHLRKPVSSEV